MFGIGTSSKETLVAVIDIASADAGLAVVAVGKTTRTVVAKRSSLPSEGRTKEALASGVIEQLSLAGESVLSDLAKTPEKGRPVSEVYVVVGAPWSHSVTSRAQKAFEKETLVKDALIGELAKQAFSEQKDVDRSKLLEASVVRVTLNGYPTALPEGKRATSLAVFALISDCDPEIKRGVEEAAGRWFPGAKLSWRSNARAVMSSGHASGEFSEYVAVDLGAEATDIFVIRKDTLTDHALVAQGVRSITATLAPGAPLEETLGLLEMLGRDECEGDACEKLKESITKAEPDLVRYFGEAFGELAAKRRLPRTLVLLAPTQLLVWLDSFFSRIDFTQFTVTAQPFSVHTPHHDSSNVFKDEGLFIATSLVNTELDKG